jgi:tRNA pseudouridine13 synthase
MYRSRAVLKRIPADFLVREGMALELAPAAKAVHEYLIVRKCGYTTVEAVDFLAKALNVAREQISYAGLKDEDAITEQMVGVPIGLDTVETEQQLASEGWRWLTVQRYGYGVCPLEIGRLAGNAFRIVVRNLDPEHAAQISRLRRIPVFVLNYYDTQRFGVPDGPKRTHYVGAALIGQDWDTALSELIGLRAKESEQASAWSGSPQEFFGSLDPRIPSFYLAAHASAKWNDQLAALVRDTCHDSVYQVTFEGIDYLWTCSSADAARILGQASTLAYPRYLFKPDGIEVTGSSRSTVVQVTVTASDEAADEFQPGKSRITLSFFLPSGCYATSAVRQILGYC